MNLPPLNVEAAEAPGADGTIGMVDALSPVLTAARRVASVVAPVDLHEAPSQQKLVWRSLSRTRRIT
jgi:hypothetical protein